MRNLPSAFGVSGPWAGRAAAAALAWAALTLPTLLGAQDGAANLAADLKAAMAKADQGDPAALAALADGGRADAQYYAGLLYLRGRDKVPADGKKGCAYMQRAAASRAEAAHIVGECYRMGIGGERDVEKAKAAYASAAAMGSIKSKCAQGDLLMAEPANVAKGVDLCKEGARAGDLASQVRLAELYDKGGTVKRNPKEARAWYDLAAKQNHPSSMRRLGEMYAKGEGGRKDPKQAVELWQRADKAGDPLAPILVADQLFLELTGRKDPGSGQYAFHGGIPKAQVGVVESWYQAALDNDPRPEVKARAKEALRVLGKFKTASDAVSVRAP